MAANVAINPAMIQLSRMVSIRQLIDSILADKPSEEVEANLYSARLHVMRAIAEQAVEVSA